MNDLELAQQLIDHGIPVVVCTPRRGWKSGQTVADVVPPAGWNTITAAECDLSKFRPGKDALAMVAGHGLDVVDLDAKAGASPADLPDFHYFGVHRTPSGGWHYFVPSTGYGKQSPLIVGMKAVGDYCGGTEDGASRLLAFLPGSTRPKYPGAHYTIEKQLDIAAALDSAPDERLLAMLVEAGCTRDGATPERAVDDAGAKAFLDRHRTKYARSCKYGRRAVADLLSEADVAATGGRHGWATRSVNRVVELMRSGCATSDDYDRIEAALRRIKPEGGTDIVSVLRWAIANANGTSKCSIHAIADATAVLDGLDGSDGLPERGGDQILDEILAFGSRFIAWPSPEAAIAWVAWVAHTHLIEDFDTTPRLAIIAPEKGSGKTRVLEVTETLVPGPLRAASATTAALFREIAKDDPITVLIDEADAIWAIKGGNEDLRAMLNAGHRRGSDVLRIVGEGASMKTQAFSTFAPVALAGIGDLPDTLMDRSIVIRMKRRSKGEKVEPFRFRSGHEQGRELREALTAWADSIPGLDIPDDLSPLQDRAADVWEPLIAVADAAGGDWPEKVRAAGVAMTTEDTGDMSLRVRLLADLRTIWPDGFDWTSTSELLRLLADLDDAPWAPDGPFGINGITPRKLSGMLRHYDIKPCHDTTKTQRGYLRADLADAWDRYLKAPPVREPSNPSNPSGLEVVA